MSAVNYRLVRTAGPAPAMAAGAAGAPAAPLVPDDAQAQVVAHRRGPLLVLGAPGTGKTTTLVEAVAARLAEGAAPEQLLVITYGRRAAWALRERIEARMFGDSPALGPARPPPMVRTVHSYAFDVLRHAAADLGDPPPRLLTGPEQDLVLRELLSGPTQGWPAGLHPALRTRGFAGQLRDLLLRCSERGITAGDLAEMGRQRGRPEWVAAAEFIHQYEEILALREATGRTGAAYDNAELIRVAAQALADDPALLQARRDRLHSVYVDELADIDPAQWDLLELIAGGGSHLVAFADPDSSTFGFRGADPAAVARFGDRFRAADGTAAPTVTLRRSYRAGTKLLEAAMRIALRLRGPVAHRDRHPAADLPVGDVEVATFPSTGSQAGHIAYRFREAHLIDGVPWDRMAVIARSTRNSLAPLRRALLSAGVPVTTHAEDLPLHTQPAVAALLLALRVALAPDQLDEKSAVALLQSPLGGVDPLADRRLRQGLRALAVAAGDRRPSNVLLVEAVRNPAELAAVERRWAAPARMVAGLLQAVRQAASQPGATAEDTLWALWQASGLAARWSAVSAQGGSRGEAADRDLDAVMVLFDAAARFSDRMPGARTGLFVEHVSGQELPADTLAATADRGPAVRILTAHAAKGLQWDVVAIAGVQEGSWPDLRLRGSVLGAETMVDITAGRAAGLVGTGGAILASQSAALLDEERRLFYVAVTRARRRLIVTAVASGDGEEQPSRFLRELVPDDPDGTAAEPAAPDLPPDPRRPRALSLPALVAQLRAALDEPTTAARRRQVAADQLARLAAAGVPGADPDQWWGLAPLSDDRPLADHGEPVTVTPSTVDTVSRCSLRWLLERHGGAAQASPEQGVGNLVHAAAMLATGADVDRSVLLEYVDGRFDEIEVSARWLAGRERVRAEQMIDKLYRWLAANPRRLAAIEAEFLVRLDEVTQIKGRVDRLEIDDQSRLVVVDLKTGKSTSVTEADLGQQPQLGAYQAAVAAGAFDDLGTVSGGASLVQLGTHVSAKEQVQPPLAEADDPQWAAAMVKRTAATMAAATFQAVVNSKCRACPVRTACPVSGKGRQVTEGGP